MTPASSALSAVQRERLGRAEAPPRRRVGAVMGEDAVREREAARASSPDVARALVEHPQPELDVPEQPALVGQLDLGAERELAGAPEVVDDRGGEQQVLVEPRVQRARLDGQRGHRDGVLEQPAEVGVVAVARARLAAQRRAQLVVAEHACAAAR